MQWSRDSPLSEPGATIGAVKQINESDVPWLEQRSPKGRFHLFRRHLSLALGAPRDAGVAGGGHPFDIEMVKLPPGATNFPFHSHSAQWEVYMVRQGSAEVRAGEVTSTVRAGDVFVCPPGEAHQIKNTGAEDLVYYVIADNPPSEVGHYPDSNKWFMKPARRCFTLQDAEYYSGEE